MKGSAARRKLIEDAIHAYVDLIEAVRGPDLSFAPDDKNPLPVEFDEDRARYLLLAASIDLGVDSSGIRYLLRDLSERLRRAGRARGLFEIAPDDARLVDDAIGRQQRHGRLRPYRARAEVARILTEANWFADGPASGDLDAWAAAFGPNADPGDAVQILATSIHMQGRDRSSARKKMWMFMRWLVRPQPDLCHWTNFDTAKLLVPVDQHVGNFASAAGIIAPIPEVPPHVATPRPSPPGRHNAGPTTPPASTTPFIYGAVADRPAGSADRTAATRSSRQPTAGARSRGRR